METLTFPSSIRTFNEDPIAAAPNLKAAYFYCNAPCSFYWPDNAEILQQSSVEFTISYAANGVGWTTPEWREYKAVPMESQGFDVVKDGWPIINSTVGYGVTDKYKGTLGIWEAFSNLSTIDLNKLNGKSIYELLPNSAQTVPKTGDETPILSLAVAVMLSVAYLSVLISKRKAAR